MAFWQTYRKRIGFLTGILFMVWIPCFFIVWSIEEGTHPEESIIGQVASAYFEFLRFPVGHMLRAGTQAGILGKLTFVGFFGGFLADALLYATGSCYTWHWLARGEARNDGGQQDKDGF